MILTYHLLFVIFCDVRIVVPRLLYGVLILYHRSLIQLLQEDFKLRLIVVTTFRFLVILRLIHRRRHRNGRRKHSNHAEEDDFHGELHHDELFFYQVNSCVEME